MSVPVKFDRCKICGNQYEWTSRRPGFCKPCRAENKRAYHRHYYGTDYVPRPSTRDPLPPVDGLMELQFARFFSLVRVRYKTQKDVSQTINMNAYKKPYTRKKINA